MGLHASVWTSQKHAQSKEVPLVQMQLALGDAPSWAAAVGIITAGQGSAKGDFALALDVETLARPPEQVLKNYHAGF